MFTDFNKWNTLKKGIDGKDKWVRPEDGEVWWCTVGRNIGVEQSCREGDFARPVLVLRSFGPRMFWGLPITSSDPHGTKAASHFFFNIEGMPYEGPTGELKTLHGFLALSQLRTFDNKRLLRKIMTMESGAFKGIREKVRSLI